ncbi:hypothetical protein [Candidatus Uabimicrobium amorphum]|uniref:Lipoprotein n=1 Tax=Uabimicrobium amorphum TaxID=2596890 RepID=A0A5S9IM15_UABAM|nr:hypothetical protein [Candidatus Uabimicrobium amorphum]BBM83520.1 hypothetical protein UABAM_01872 [Candidatus Uabimicrobium amorphum]
MKYLTIILCAMFMLVGCTCKKYDSQQNVSPVVQSDADHSDHDDHSDDNGHAHNHDHNHDKAKDVDYKRNRYNYDYHRDYTNRLHYYNRGRLP